MIPFVGPSYALASRKASVQRSVNLYLAGMETASKASFILESVPGLVQRVALGAEIRGAIEAGGRCFVVAGTKLYEINSNWTTTERGTLNSWTGPVSMAYGLQQVVMVDGVDGYVFTPGTNAFAEITDADFPGGDVVVYLDGYYIVNDPGTQSFFISALNDGSTWDALDYASAEGSPDALVSIAVTHRELWLFGEVTSEVWFNSGAAAFPFERNNGGIIEVGCLAPHSVQLVDSTLMWVGADRNGSGLVYRTNGYQATRVSTQAIEEALADSTALEDAVAYVYQEHGRTFWCVNAPGLSATWCYELSTGTWHERCDLDAFGEFTQGRVTRHVYVFGAHLGGDADGYIYEMSRTAYKNGSDALVRERTGPNDVSPTLERVYFAEFVLDTTTGETTSGSPTVELSWSNDGGQTWGDPVSRSIGASGEYFPRVIWRRLGQARDRVWRVRFDGDAPFALINAKAA